VEARVDRLVYLAVNKSPPHWGFGVVRFRYSDCFFLLLYRRSEGLSDLSSCRREGIAWTLRIESREICLTWWCCRLHPCSGVRISGRPTTSQASSPRHRSVYHGSIMPPLCFLAPAVFLFRKQYRVQCSHRLFLGVPTIQVSTRCVLVLLSNVKSDWRGWWLKKLISKPNFVYRKGYIRLSQSKIQDCTTPTTLVTVQLASSGRS